MSDTINLAGYHVLEWLLRDKKLPIKCAVCGNLLDGLIEVTPITHSHGSAVYSMSLTFACVGHGEETGAALMKHLVDELQQNGRIVSTDMFE